MAYVEYTQRQNCAACSSSSLKEILQLPKFPLTGIYVHLNDPKSYPVFDQVLLQCQDCSHGQLLNTLDPKYLYQETYTHRSSTSQIAMSGNDYFYQFVQELAPNRLFNCVAELGCNDLYLLNKLKNHADLLYGFDPIWKDQNMPLKENIRVIGKYIEEIIPNVDLPVPPDLIVSVHTLEHVSQPLLTLKPIFDAAQEGALFVVEVPCLDSLVVSSRFDQIFHQHLNYFSLASLLRMVQELGGSYVSHKFNYGYWLGTLLFAFKKDANTYSEPMLSSKNVHVLSNEDILSSFDLFQSQLYSFRNMVRHLKNRVIIRGYGAAQMVPTLAYHIQSDLDFMDCILDDNLDRAGLMFPGLKPMIRLPSEISDINESAVAVMALDSARPIIRRVSELRARYLLYPLHLF